MFVVFFTCALRGKQRIPVLYTHIIIMYMTTFTRTTKQLCKELLGYLSLYQQLLPQTIVWRLKRKGKLCDRQLVQQQLLRLGASWIIKSSKSAILDSAHLEMGLTTLGVVNKSGHSHIILHVFCTHNIKQPPICSAEVRLNV